MTYNGWSNYETWNIALWLGNEEGSDSYMRELASRAARKNTDKDSAISDLSDQIKDYVEESNPLSNDASMYSDLLSAAIRDCNFYEIAEGMIDEVWEDGEESEDAEDE